jgi:hypothetical protein
VTVQETIARQDAEASEVLQQFHQRRALAHLARFSAGSDQTEWDAAYEAISCLRQTPQAGEDALAEALLMESQLYVTRFLLAGEPLDLDKAIECGLRTATDNPGDPDFLAWLGGILRMRFELSGAVADLDKAVTVYQEAAEGTPPDATDSALRSAVLFENMFTRHEYIARKSGPGGDEQATGEATRLLLRSVRVSDEVWRWELVADGRQVASTRVVLGDAWQREPFEDLSGYLSRYSIPYATTEHLRDLMASVGVWVTAHVLGPELVSEIAARLPAIVTVRLHPRQQQLLAAPLELALVDGKSLAAAGAIFTYSLSGREPAGEPPAQTRILAVFPLPSDSAQLGLRAERLALQSVAARAAAAGMPVTLTCLQYGVTRQALRDLLAQHEYEIVHVGGHGGHEGLMLTTESGAQDFVTATELLEMLGPQRGKTRLVVLGACDTGANKAARLIGRLYSDAARGNDSLVAAERTGSGFADRPAARGDRRGDALRRRRHLRPPLRGRALRVPADVPPPRRRGLPHRARSDQDRSRRRRARRARRVHPGPLLPG